MKKMLSLAACGMFLASSSTMAVSCSLSFNPEKLLTIKLSDTTVFKDLIVNPIVNWNSAINNNSFDSKIIAKLQDTLITVDKHDNFEGALALKWKHDKDFKQWDFKLRDNIRWSGLENGRTVDKGKITAKDFFNTFRYVFNRNNRALTLDIWTSALKNGRELVDFLDKISNPNYFPDLEDTKHHKLYNQIFDKESDKYKGKPSLEKEMRSSYYLDRAIMAYNMTLDEEKSSQMALNTGLSTEKLAKESFEKGRIISQSKNEKGKETYDISFHLNKPTSYFETIISYLSFAPMPDFSVEYLTVDNDGEKASQFAGTSYSKAAGTKQGYETMWYSGPYVVDHYVSGRNLNLRRNENYFNKDNVHIHKILYSFSNKGDPASYRFFFQTGDISSFIVVPNDLAGWDTYVKNVEDPRFKGTNIVKTKPTTTWGFAFNYQSQGTTILENIRLNREGSLVEGKRTTRNVKQDADLNKTIALKSFRVMFRYMLNRSIFAKFFSSAIDGNSPTSSSLRNTYTSPFIATYKEDKPEISPESNKDNTVDYYDVMAKNYYDKSKTSKTQDKKTTTGWLIEVLKTNPKVKDLIKDDQLETWAKRFGSIEQENKTSKSALDPGKDTFFENDLLALSAFLKEDELSEKDDNFSLDQDPSKVKFKNDERAKKFIELIGKYDKVDPNKSYPDQDKNLNLLHQKVKLIKEQVKEDMNGLEINTNTPITVPFLMNPGNSSTGSATGYINFLTEALRTFNFLVRNRGNGDINSPFVIDVYTPSTSIEYSTLAKAGKSSIMEIGWSPDYADPTNYLYTVLYGGVFDYIMSLSKTFNKNSTGKLTPTKIIENDKQYYEQLRKSSQFLLNEIEKVDVTIPDHKKRFEELSKLENYLTLSSALIIPTFVKESESLPTVSYVDQLTISRFPLGTHPQRMVGVKIDEKIIQQHEFQERLKVYNEEKISGYQSLYPDANNQYLRGFKGDWNKEVDPKNSREVKPV
ncbi:Oligopeptide ABC transporter, substrate-binding protein [Mycoplasma yeatsii 13926]|uniref:Oligopeptide ABC transporter, substrate-binding protein n=1 Tax=Mycoplasma yeatsii 13926 TaxID=1188240 RepID=S6G8U8_9MOLU|nr:oligopeptide ABC transporter substrate-binding protein OppA [Mycoplasma yeatsii]EOA07265.1 Oligopeptide ABC transporter, substrate-binding protein [Mycoplasma yeatsii 13926]